MKNCGKNIQNTFIPTKGNGYLPLFLRHYSLKVIAVFVIIVKIGVSIFLAFSPVSVRPVDITNQNIINMTNQQRLDHSLAQLKLDSRLSQAAYAKAQNMLAEQYFAHYSPSNISPWHWFKQAGYEYAYAGENLAMDFVQAEDVINAWMASDTHRRNILNANYTELGIGIVEGEYKGAKTVMVVQVFATPAPPVTLAVSSSVEEVVQKESVEEKIDEAKAEEMNLVEVQKEETVVLPSPVQADTYDVVTKLKEEVVEEEVEEEVKEEKKPTKVAVELGGSTGNLNKVADDYIGSVTDTKEISRRNINILTEDGEKNVVTTPILNTGFFGNAIVRPAAFFSSERLIQIILYSRNFFLALFVFLSLVLILNLLVKVRVQHKPNILYSLLVLYLIGVLIII